MVIASSRQALNQNYFYIGQGLSQLMLEESKKRNQYGDMVVDVSTRMNYLVEYC